MRMYARTDERGTAMAETALCSVCTAGRLAKDMSFPGSRRAPIVDCSENDCLECIECGTATHPDRFVNDNDPED